MQNNNKTPPVSQNSSNQPSTQNTPRQQQNPPKDDFSNFFGHPNTQPKTAQNTQAVNPINRPQQHTPTVPVAAGGNQAQGHSTSHKGGDFANFFGTSPSSNNPQNNQPVQAPKPNPPPPPQE